MRTKKSSSPMLTQLTGRRLQRRNCSCATRFAKRKRLEILRTWRNWRSNSPLKSRVCGKIARRRKKNCGLASENSRPRLLWQTGFRACRFSATCQRHVCHDRRAACLPLRKIRIEKAEHVRALDHAHAFLLLQFGNLPAERFQFRPVHLWPKMMFGVVAIEKEKPIVNFAVAAHAPRDRFIRISAIMPEVTVEIAKTVTEIKKRQEIKDDVAPIE